MFDNDGRIVPRANFTLEPYYSAVVTAIEAATRKHHPTAIIRYHECNGCSALHGYVLTEWSDHTENLYFEFHIAPGQWHEKS